MREEKKIIVFEENDIQDIPSNPEEFLDYWKLKFNLIPPEYKNNAYIELIGRTRWEDDDCLDVEIYYIRPETDEEYTKRLDMERLAEFQQEEREREQLRKLKEKYGE